ncbi:MAG: 1,2-phenylacetyl-CoA epoxidase subunit PaaD [Egibacteraceae bacterium]
MVTRPPAASQAPPSPQQVRATLDAVADPEMPAVSIGDLGMVVGVRVDGGRVEVDLVATFSACPATALIGHDVAAAVGELDGVTEVVVRFVQDVVWEPGRISARGREQLRAFGIAPPGSGQALPRIGGVRCPLCGSRDTGSDTPFGPTPCRAVHYCRACRNPFEAIKP